MKKVKRIMCLLLAMVMACSVGFAVNGTEAKANESPSTPVTRRITAPKKALCGIGAAQGETVKIPLQDTTWTVKNVKAYQGKKKTKQLVIRKVYTDLTKTEDDYRREAPYAAVTFFAKKAGKYTVKYDLYANGVKAGKGKFTVKAQGYGSSQGIFSSVAVDGKNMKKFIKTHDPRDVYYTKNNKIKIKFKTTPRYNIAKIEMIYRDANGNQVVKRIKNGKKVKLGQYANIKATENSFQKDTWAETAFKVTFVDKYSQTVYDQTNGYDEKDHYETYIVRKRAKKWCTYKDWQPTDVEY